MNDSVLITGCSQGIGRAISLHFLEMGWDVYGVDLSPCHLPLKHFFQKDVSQIETFTHIANVFQNSKVQLSSIINNAAIQTTGSMVEMSPEEWNLLMKTNLSSIFYCLKELYTYTMEGSIINIASVHARATSKGMGAYATSKGALCALTRAAAIELGEYGIRVNAILPGAIDTEMLQKGLQRNHSPSEALQKIVNSSPLKSIGEGSDVANLAYFLANHKLSKNITGQEFVVDGGVLARLASE